MLLEKLQEQYRYNLNNWLTGNKYEVSEHIKDICVSVLLHRDRIVDYGGSFVQAFIANNLHNVIRYADNDVMANLRIIYQAYQNIDTYHHAQAYRELVAAEAEKNTVL
jgi:hypothetical protein